MDDNAPKENPPTDFNKLDLSQLQGFSFGTQWSQEKSSPADRGAGGERTRHDDRRDGGGAPDRRDRRAFRRPAGAEGSAPAGEAGGPGRRESFDASRPRQGGGGDFRGGPRREGGPAGSAGERGPRYGQGGQGYAGRGGPPERGPYESPYYSATFYPEDTSFNTLVQTIRKTCRTVELFEIARTVVAKIDRFVVVVTHRPQHAAPTSAASEEGASAAAKPAKPVFYVSVPDGIPFETDEDAVAHVLGRHLDKFFDTAEVEVDPPKGNFLVINRCGLTGALLGPPNYHRYNQIVQQHYAAKVGSRMAFEAFRSRIETIRDPEIVNQWLAQMKKATRYTWKLSGAATPAATPSSAATPAPATPPSGDATSDGNTTAPAETPAVVPTEVAPAPAVVPAFDTLEEARVHLLTQAREKAVRTTDTARFHGKVAESMPPGEIRRAVEGALERQRRFPLDTANALRGRLRREHFTIFKKGSKGVSYVCAVKRKFRVPGQTFADSIGALISFLEANPMVRASELVPKFLGITGVPAPKPAAPVEPAAPAPAEGVPETTPAAPETGTGLSIENRARLARLQGDLVWLVREGYVTEFIDGRLFASPPVVEARKKEAEVEEHDPENFPDVPPTPGGADTGPAPVAATAAVEDAAPPAAPVASDVVLPPAVETPPPGEQSEPPTVPPAGS